ncbi:MAG: hypothetical protein OXN97_06645 [Bryobacterales bacterium]|nr:hypothetical protein [Bryobacterales bacterium]
MKRKKNSNNNNGNGNEVFAAPVKEHLDARARVALRVDQIRLRRVKYTRRLMPGLEKRLAAAKESSERLLALLRERRDMFERPRTRTIDGLTIGWRTVPRKLRVPDPATTAKAIRTLMPERAETLINTKETVPVAGLKKLDDETLAALGVEIEEAREVPQIRMAKDSLDRQVEAVLEQHKADRAGAGEAAK